MLNAFKVILLLVTVALFGAGAYAQQASTKEASRRVQNILTADLAGTSVSGDIALLTDYVGKHMGSSIDFSLSGSYNRAEEAFQSYQTAAAAAQQANSQIYAEAQAACAGKADSIVQARCNTAYLNAHIQNVHIPDPVPEPKEADYYYNLVAPPWTADVTGALYLDGVISLILTIVAVIIWRKKR
jgi:hypothetical protein